MEGKYSLIYVHFLIMLSLSASLTDFAAAQSYTHDHLKMQTKSDTSLVKNIHKKIVKERYTCPMHPEVISDQPGKCPKCRMSQVKVKSSPIIRKSQKMQINTIMSHPDKMYKA